MSMHIGVDDKILSTIKSQNKLPKDMCGKIDKLLDNLQETDLSVFKRNQILEELVALTLKYRPRNFKEYLWYTKFACCIMLLHDTPIYFCVQKSQLLIHTFQTPTELWDACPIKIDLIADSLYELLSDDYNLVFIVKHICNLNRLAYYVSVALVWAAMYRFADIKTKMFRMHKIGDLIKLLETIDIKNLNNRLIDVHKFLTLISVFQGLVILRKPRHIEYFCFRSFFKVNKNDLMLIKCWLDKLKSQIEICVQKHEDQVCFQIIELLELDILHFMKPVEDEHVNDLY